MRERWNLTEARRYAYPLEMKINYSTSRLVSKTSVNRVNAEHSTAYVVHTITNLIIAGDPPDYHLNSRQDWAGVSIKPGYWEYSSLSAH